MFLRKVFIIVIATINIFLGGCSKTTTLQEIDYGKYSFLEVLGLDRSKNSKYTFVYYVNAYKSFSNTPKRMKIYSNSHYEMGEIINLK